MGEARGLAIKLDARLAAVLLAGASLAACASTDMGGKTSGIGPRYPTRETPNTGQPSKPRPPQQAQGAYKVGKPYQVNGIWYTPQEDPNYDETGIASWYGDAFQLRPTASGELFDMYMPSAAHKTLPLQSIVEVTNLENGRKIEVRINDRGPFVDGRIIDLSRAAADELGMVRSGVARVRVRYVGVSGQKAAPPYIVASNPKAPADTAKPLVIAMAPIPNPPEPTAVAAAPPPPQPIKVAAAPTPAFEVQAAAFSDPANAERVRRQLESAGRVEVRPLQRDDVTLYRVVVCSLLDESMALAVRDRLAAQGFSDARIIRPTANLVANLPF